MRKCQCDRCTPKQPKNCTRLYRESMSAQDQSRYSSPRFWCECGAWKYDDAFCCDDCWKEREPYIDR